MSNWIDLDSKGLGFWDLNFKLLFKDSFFKQAGILYPNLKYQSCSRWDSGFRYWITGPQVYQSSSLFGFFFGLLATVLHVCTLSRIQTFPVLYTTNPTERSAAATERSMNESDLESPVESHRALAEQCPSKSVECSGSTQRALDGILQVILSHFCLSSAQWLLPSARWDQWCSVFFLSRIHMNFISSGRV